MGRKEEVSIYHKTYSRVDCDWNYCYYCGSDWNLTVDHVPAITNASRVNPVDRWLVPACKQCNSILGDRGLYLEDKCIFLYERLKKKFKKILSTPEWTHEEIEDLGRSLKGKVKAIMSEKKEAERRLEHLENRL